jgi:uncharacterized protein YxjI
MGIMASSDEQKTRTFMMKEKMFGLGDDFWIDDDSGAHAYKVDGKTHRIRDTWKLEDVDGNEVAVIRERMLSVRDAIKIEYGDHKAVVKKQLIGFGEKYNVDIEDGEDLKVKGDFIGHEYTIERDGDTLAEVSKKWFRVRESYGIEVRGDIDPALVIAVAVAIDSLHGAEV